jgi:hypothetical protein
MEPNLQSILEFDQWSGSQTLFRDLHSRWGWKNRTESYFRIFFAPSRDSFGNRRCRSLPRSWIIRGIKHLSQVGGFQSTPPSKTNYHGPRTCCRCESDPLEFFFFRTCGELIDLPYNTAIQNPHWSSMCLATFPRDRAGLRQLIKMPDLWTIDGRDRSNFLSKQRILVQN